MWSAGQKREFAKEIIASEFKRGAATSYLTSEMRVALVEARCFSIAIGQHAETVSVAAMTDLLQGVREAIEAKLGRGFFDP